METDYCIHAWNPVPNHMGIYECRHCTSLGRRDVKEGTILKYSDGRAARRKIGGQEEMDAMWARIHTRNSRERTLREIGLDHLGDTVDGR